jgi:hypothetical protein
MQLLGSGQCQVILCHARLFRAGLFQAIPGIFETRMNFSRALLGTDKLAPVVPRGLSTADILIVTDIMSTPNDNTVI